MKTETNTLYRKTVADGITIMNTQPEHAAQLEELQKTVFPTLAKESLMRAEHYLHHIKIFPEGQFVAVKDGKVIGMTSSIRYGMNLNDNHTFNDVLDGGYMNTHKPDGQWLYGMDLGTHPDFRGKGIAGYLYDARQELVYNLKLKGQYTFGMMSGYGAKKNEMTAEEYYEQMLEGKIKDPTVSRQMKNGFVPHGLVHGYLIDPVCDDYCVLIIRINDRMKDEEEEEDRR
jgi:GNAT superfamily N-acetyltransferase